MKTIASFEAVCAAADSLQAAGLEPSTLAVQERIGGGSFTTVKRHLAAWAARRAQEAAATPELPPELQSRAQEFSRTLWAMAVAQAQADVQQVKDAAQIELAALKKELAEASGEILRLEGVEVRLSEALEALQTRLRAVDLARVEAQARAEQVPKLVQALAEAHAELTRKAEDHGRLAGELGAAQNQLHELKAALKK